jgi:r1t holin
MFTKKFWADASQRAIRAFASTLLSVLGVGTTHLLSVPWEGALTAAGGGALVSLLTSIVGSVVTNDPTSASIVNSPPVTMKEMDIRGVQLNPGGPAVSGG